MEPLASTNPASPVGRKMRDEVLYPCVVGIGSGWIAIGPTLVTLEQITAPIAIVEWRIGNDVIGLQVRVIVGVEGVAVADLRVNATDGKVHLGQPPCGVVGLLPVDGNVADAPAMCLNELLALHEHSAGAAAGVIDAALVRSKHLHQYADNVGGRVKLSAFLAFGAGELREEVFIDAAEHILGAVRRTAKGDIAHQIDELAESLLVEAGAGVVLGQNTLAAMGCRARWPPWRHQPTCR